MKHLLKNMILLLTGTCVVSCASQYHVEGVTDRGSLEGKMLYVKVFENDNMVAIDSCEVRHGQLKFMGELDSTKFVTLFVDDQYIGPLVLEEGEIKLALNEFQSELKGSPYNDSLNIFLCEYQRLYQARMMLADEYQHCEKNRAQLILDGMTEEECNARCDDRMSGIMQRLAKIDSEQDQLETNFVVNNSGNILGPGVFMLVTWNQPYPYLTPQIEEILLRACPSFKEHPYVKRYIEAAKQNMEQMRQ